MYAARAPSHASHNTPRRGCTHVCPSPCPLLCGSGLTQGLAKPEELIDWAYSSEAGAGDWARIVRRTNPLIPWPPETSSRNAAERRQAARRELIRSHLPLTPQAALAPVVTAAEKDGDAVARGILDAAADGLLDGAFLLRLLQWSLSETQDTHALICSASAAFFRTV